MHNQQKLCILGQALIETWQRVQRIVMNLIIPYLKSSRVGWLGTQKYAKDFWGQVGDLALVEVTE